MSKERTEEVFSLLVQDSIRSFCGIEVAPKEKNALEQITSLEYEQASQLLDSKIGSLTNYLGRFSVEEYQRITCLDPKVMDQIGLRKKVLQSQKEISSRVPYYLLSKISTLEIENQMEEEYRWIASLLGYVTRREENPENLIENIKQLTILESILRKIEDPDISEIFLEGVYEFYHDPVTRLSQNQLSIATLYSYMQEKMTQPKSEKVYFK